MVAIIGKHKHQLSNFYAKPLKEVELR